MERWNAYTKDGTLTNQILIREKSIPKGLYHMVCEVLVCHRNGTFLCMKRDLNKATYPGYIEASAGGSALYGEDKWQCISRELFEETGIKCDLFTEVNQCVSEDEQSLFYSFVCEVDVDQDCVTLQDGETIDYYWLNLKQFQEYLNSSLVIPTQKDRYMSYFIDKKILQ